MSSSAVKTEPSALLEPTFPGLQEFVAPPPNADCRIYVCDTENHHVDVFDDSHRLLCSFGGFGSDPGQFNEPTDVTVVSLNPTDGNGSESPQAIAVADRGNHRVQLFDCDGELGAVLDPWHARGRHLGCSDRAGWPFFRANPLPQLVSPSTLQWQAPCLEITSADGRTVSLDLSVALLSDFSAWLESASPAELRDALSYFLRQEGIERLPATHLRELASRAPGGLSVVGSSQTWRTQRVRRSTR